MSENCSKDVLYCTAKELFSENAPRISHNVLPQRVCRRTLCRHDYLTEVSQLIPVIAQKPSDQNLKYNYFPFDGWPFKLINSHTLHIKKPANKNKQI